MKKNLILFCVSLTFTLLLVEIVLRIFAPQISSHDAMFMQDNSLGWKFVPNKTGTIIYPGLDNQTIRTNSIGYRDGEIETNNQSKKIMVLGDSFVTNVSVDDHEVFTEVMEASLDDTAVLNFGVNGYGTIQEFMVLKEWVPKVNPDVIVFMIYLRNDFTDNVKRGEWLYPRPTVSLSEDETELIMNPMEALSQSKPKTAWKFWRKLHLFHFVQTRVNAMSSSQPKDIEHQFTKYTPPELYLCKKSLSEETKLMYTTLQKLLIEISNYTAHKNISIVYALAPSILQVDDTLWSTTISKYSGNPNLYDPALPNNTLMNFAKDNDLMMIDLLPILQEGTREGKVFYNKHEHHWTPDGNAQVSEIILSYLESKSLVK